jgi:imidazolonepropionase-like amidohydrolase
MGGDPEDGGRGVTRPIRRLSLAGLALAAAAGLNGAAHAASRCDLAITHVNVVPMTASTILRDRTVLVSGGRIESVSKARVAPTRCAQTVDGHGGYLLPGLNDLHVHLDSAAFAQAFKVRAPPVDYADALAPYLAAGVTGVRVMSGAPDILAFRNGQRGPASPWPRLVVASPMLSGDPPVIAEPLTKVVTTPEAGRAAVDGFAAAGYDFLKVRDNLKPDVLRAIILEGRAHGLYVDGHISQGQGLSAIDVLVLGQHAVAHLDNFALAMKSDADASRFAEAMAACSCFVSSTLQVEQNAVAQITGYDRMISRPGVKLMDPILVKLFWAKPNNGYIASKADPGFFRELLRQDGVLLRAFHKAGVPVVAGTDALNPMILPGESLLDELDAMVRAGLSPYDALRTATATPAAVVPGFADLGVLAAGKTANAVLVTGNPLAGLKTLRTPQAVMINGNWLTTADLQHGVDRAVANSAAIRGD